MTPETMTDNELITWMVQDEVWAIHLQRKFRHNPLAVPIDTPERRAQTDAAWAECIRRGLHLVVDERARAIVDK